ncbi:hypothetical protein B6S12_07685 [Helicobacter valdiviensis]|uniref:Uncharacterized protein n=1 Tax=Helicobacter valdiviensis TaxID=1458358 RepID=A0A2W6MT61_9HELI|nr:hypothetical protein [Helicobacter valdiviensis]PZT47734.1 hypothetical protein B6S12_07685 [Helicobacter valdiviensis]
MDVKVLEFLVHYQEFSLGFVIGVVVGYFVFWWARRKELEEKKEEIKLKMQEIELKSKEIELKNQEIQDLKKEVDTLREKNLKLSSIIEIRDSASLYKN